MTDHKAALRALAAQDGCEASLKAADHIEYLERRLVSSRDYEKNLCRKLERVRHQRNELRRQLTEKTHGGNIASCDCCSDLDGGRGDDRRDGGAAVEPV